MEDQIYMYSEECCQSDRFAAGWDEGHTAEPLSRRYWLDCEMDEQTIQTARGISFAAEDLEKVTIYCTEGDARVPLLVNILRANARSLDQIDVKAY